MKKIYSLFILSTLIIGGTSCKKYLDVNTNPNQAINSTPPLTLNNALVVTAANTVGYNIYGSGVSGGLVNAGGFGGFGSLFTYSYANNEFTGQWTSVYDNLSDYQYVISQTQGVAGSEQFNAVAKIMKAYDYQLLVDVYGDVPYSEALKGTANVAPKYDKGIDIYQSLVKTIDTALITLKANPTASKAFSAGADVLFNGDVTKWRIFGNTLKLKLLTRIQAVPALTAFVTAEYATIDQGLGFLTFNALVQPGYTGTDGKQNPSWNSIYANAAKTLSGNGRQYITSQYAISFYNGAKLSDDDRGSYVYRGYPGTPAGILSSSTNPNAPTGNPDWYIGDPDLSDTQGILKGKSAAAPLLLASEAYFLVAEAQLNGHLSGSAQESFDNGIKASYEYLTEDVTNATSGEDLDAYLAAYKDANDGSYLVNYELATSNAERLEAIITQKYIANNFIFGEENWAEFRRTGYPKISGSNPINTFVSPQSVSTHADKLPVRLPYPDTEYQLNSKNVPQGVSNFTSTVFWDLN